MIEEIILDVGLVVSIIFLIVELICVLILIRRAEIQAWKDGGYGDDGPYG